MNSVELLRPGAEQDQLALPLLSRLTGPADPREKRIQT
jgi:hypothetical protein